MAQRTSETACSAAAAARPVTAWRGQQVEETQDLLAVEEPLEIRVDDKPLAVTMRTPGHDSELAAGFCLTEGICHQHQDVEALYPCPHALHGNVIVLRLSDAARVRCGKHLEECRRRFFVSSSCGLCGKESIDHLQQRTPPLPGTFALSRRLLLELPAQMAAAQTAFAQTGGLHAAAIFDSQGTLRVVREDVGRHNAVDKAVGFLFLGEQLPLSPGLLLVSGRTSFEIVQKAAMAGIAIVAGVSAPSSLAVDFASKVGMTLVGFLRPERMNVYHDPGRLVP